jgi:hypothetical protein
VQKLTSLGNLSGRSVFYDPSHEVFTDTSPTKKASGWLAKVTQTVWESFGWSESEASQIKNAFVEMCQEITQINDLVLKEEHLEKQPNLKGLLEAYVKLNAAFGRALENIEQIQMALVKEQQISEEETASITSFLTNFSQESNKVMQKLDNTAKLESAKKMGGIRMPGLPPKQ